MSMFATEPIIHYLKGFCCIPLRGLIQDNAGYCTILMVPDYSLFRYRLLLTVWEQTVVATADGGRKITEVAEIVD